MVHCQSSKSEFMNFAIFAVRAGTKLFSIPANDLSRFLPTTRPRCRNISTRKDARKVALKIAVRYGCHVPTTNAPLKVLPQVAFDFFSQKFKLYHYCVNDWQWEIGLNLLPEPSDPAKGLWCNLVYKPATITAKPGIGFYKVTAGAGSDESKPKLWAGLLNGFGVVREFNRVVSETIVPKALSFWRNLDLTTQREHEDVRFMCAPEKADFRDDFGVFTGYDRDLGAGHVALIKSPLIFGYFKLKSYPQFQDELITYCETNDETWDRSLLGHWEIFICSAAYNYPIADNVIPVTYERRKRFAGRTDLPVWREQHREIILGRKFRRQQKIVEEDNQAGGRGRAGTGIRKLLAKAGDIASDALLKALTKEVKKRSKVAGAAAGFAVKLAKAALKKKAATSERQRKRGLKPTVRSMKIDTKEEVQARYDKEVKAAARGVEVSQVKQDKELERILRREKAAIKRQNRKILEQRRRWLKHQNKIEREKRKFAKQVARLVKEADKKALRKFSFRQKRPCLPTQQRRPRRKRKRLTSRGRASRRPATKRKK